MMTISDKVMCIVIGFIIGALATLVLHQGGLF